MLKGRVRYPLIVSTAVIALLAGVSIDKLCGFLESRLPERPQVIPVEFAPEELLASLAKRKVYLEQRTEGVGFEIHKIKMRENLWKIANKRGYSVHTLIGCNPQMETYEVFINQKILIPDYPGSLHIIRKDDTLKAIAERYDIEAEKISEFNPGVSVLKEGLMLFVPDRRPDIRLMNEKMREKYELRALFVSPVGGRLTSTFGRRRHPVTRTHGFHGGIDIAVKEGTIVGAAADGIVTCASSGIGHYGTAVFVDHRNGYETHYGHLSSVRVRVGQKVKAHQFVGRSGSTGRVTGPHLHFTIKKNGVPIDPLKFLW